MEIITLVTLMLTILGSSKWASWSISQVLTTRLNALSKRVDELGVRESESREKLEQNIDVLEQDLKRIEREFLLFKEEVAKSYLKQTEQAVYSGAVAV